MFTKISNMRLDHVAGKTIYFNKLRSPLFMGGMAAAGIGITYIANTKTAMLQKLEDDRLAFRINAPEKPSTHQANQKELHDGAAPPENFQEYDKKWLARYRNQAFQKGLYDAIANAAFFGMFSSMSTLLLDKVGGKPMAGEFSPTRSPLAMGGMMSIGTMFAYMGQAKGAAIKQLHSDRLAYRVKAEETNDPPEKPKEKSEPEPERRSIRFSDIESKALNTFPPLITINPAHSPWQQRVAATRNLTPKTVGLHA